MKNYFFMFGHSQPLEQSLQHEHSHLQFGQSLQQSFEQQLPALPEPAQQLAEVAWPVMPAVNKAVPRSRPLNNLTIMRNSLSWIGCS